MIDLSNKIKSLRELKGWTQDEFALRLGISRSAVGNYEQGTREPDFETLENIADTLNCKMSDLLGEESFFCSEDEKELIRHYRVANDTKKEIVLDILHVKKETDSDLSKVAN